MAQSPAAGGATPPASLRGRAPACAAIAGFLACHDQSPRQSWLARGFGVCPLDESSRWRYRRALGALGAGESLARLDPRWTVLHAVPQGAGQADLDHVAIGPAGVICVRTVAAGHGGGPGAVTPARTTSSEVRQSEFEVGRVERFLGLAHGSPVTAIGVIVADLHSTTGRDLPRDVVVVHPASLVGVIEALPTRLDEQEIGSALFGVVGVAAWGIVLTTAADYSLR